ncbi:hypothetical protein [Pseudooctadecabacter jejudonensis]|uniref:SH3b domain-containing protein n=1 Tax=Pseudooctadecabacter jejudonensis TaxID=1391910 RepID=A0A1Y5RIY3_9RHOB|nr:hypothetical protein [Pseudooctadecabacter jejudonensis]SLN18704.1 hypothetical protein PSJ8397_00621 [Pseudooctadecabacter jejudonensis]
MKSVIFALLAMTMAAPVLAETRTYGRVDLTGLSRDTSWPYNAAGLSYVMVCNVNGPDGFLTVRSGPGTDFAQERAFNRLAILEVDTTQRRGNWVRVVDAHRTHTKDGAVQDFKPLPVSGWAHDGYMCSFLD